MKVDLNFLIVDCLNFYNFSKSEPILIIFVSLDSASSKTPGEKFLDQNVNVLPCFWKRRKSFDAKNSSAEEFQIRVKIAATKASYVTTQFSVKKAAAKRMLQWRSKVLHQKFLKIIIGFTPSTVLIQITSNT